MTETVPYEITGNSGEIEFRRYPELLLASVKDTGDEGGFRLLFKYITGANRAQGKIPMTAPVITADNIPMTTPVITSESIPMTAPVVSAGRSMSFVMPVGKTRNELPVPLDTRIQIATVPPREVAVLRFSGYAGQEDVDKAAHRLLDGLREAGITTQGEIFLMRYNAPWTPGFLRRNEVAIEILR
jgi:SOUL heme-binding protein